MSYRIAYQLPYGDVFATQHSAKARWHVAQEGLILLSEIGSTMHGVSSDDTGDDIDLMGVCIEPPIEVLGLGDSSNTSTATARSTNGPERVIPIS